MTTIAYDEKIPYIKDVIAQCSKQSQLQLSAHAFTGTDAPTEIIKKAQIVTAQVLIVRSVTEVNASLLTNSAVKMVITATAGVDHIDEAYLRERHIALKTTHGSNANAVSEYVLAVFLAYLSTRQKLFEHRSEHFSIKHILRETSVAIIGCGNIGSQLYDTFEQLGVNVIGYDPPLLKKASAHQSHHAKPERYSSLAEVHGADFITFHVPLTYTGLDATYHMCDKRFLAALRKKPWIINTARGGVIDEIATTTAFERGLIGGIVLDVWEGEPEINPAVLAKTIFATPHSAGYSKEASFKTAKKIFEHLIVYLRKNFHNPRSHLPARFHLPQSDLSDLMKPKSISGLSLFSPVTKESERVAPSPPSNDDNESLMKWLVHFCLQSSGVPALTTEIKKYYLKNSKYSVNEAVNRFQKLRAAMRERHEWSAVPLLAGKTSYSFDAETRFMMRTLGFQ